MADDDAYAPDYADIQGAYDRLLEGDVGACIDQLQRFLNRKGLLTADDRVVRAVSEVRTHYHASTVNGICDEFAKAWRDGEYAKGSDAALQALEESCDAACTYIFDAMMVLAFSKNDDAIIQTMGEFPHDGNAPNWGAAATMALRADVVDQLHQIDGIDVNDVPPTEPVIDCDACGEWKPSKGDICDECSLEEAEDGENGGNEGEGDDGGGADPLRPKHRPQGAG